MAVGEIVAGAVEGTGKLGLDIYDRWSAQENKNRAKRNIEKATEKAELTYDDVMKILEQYKDEHTSLASPEMYAKYTSLVEGYDPSAFDYDFDKFQYDKSVEDYVNPYYDKIIGQTADTLQHTAAGAGLGRGTGAALNIATGVAQKEDELYKTALSEYNQDRSQQYREYADYIANMQNRLNNLSNRTLEQAKLLGGAIGSDETFESDFINALTNAMTDKAQVGLQGRLSANA